MQKKLKPWDRGVKPSQSRKIGPWLSVWPHFEHNMQTAYDTDCEAGSHWLNEAKSDLLNREFPTVVAMARLIEEERNQLKKQLRQLTKKGQSCKPRKTTKS